MIVDKHDASLAAFDLIREIGFRQFMIYGVRQGHIEPEEWKEMADDIIKYLAETENYEECAYIRDQVESFKKEFNL